jgi:hypothetical protein
VWLFGDYLKSDGLFVLHRKAKQGMKNTINFAIDYL